MATRCAALGLVRILLSLSADAVDCFAASVRFRQELVTEHLFLRRQLAPCVERQARRRRANDATRIALVLMSRIVDWRPLLTVVKPDTLLRWHRQGFRLWWRWKSRPRGRPRIPHETQRLIVEIATANRLWGQERIAAELNLKLGLRLSARTIRRNMPLTLPPRGRRDLQTWSTFVRNHARATLACDFSSPSPSPPPFTSSTSLLCSRWARAGLFTGM